MNRSKNQLMQAIYESGFALDDILLYLDTHPCDKEAINYYQYVRRLRREAMDAYMSEFGPLMKDQVNDNNCWNWVNDPWPWEGGNN